MLNDGVIVGRITQLPSNLNSLIVIKSQDLHQKDFNISVKCTLHMLEAITKYCQLNDIVGIRGCLTEEFGTLILEAKKISFLSRVNDGPDSVNN